MTESRKIAAILVSDIVGFSRLAGADEDRLLARLRALRSDLIDPIIAVHRGRVVKRTGDGALVEFRSVVDAVRCAIEVQNGMIERNAGIPAERRIEFRMGIHLGDVVEEADGDLMGDGVNIAARLEGVAQPGSICLSEDAYRQVSSRLDMTVSDLGPTQLKNIDRPIRVYSLRVGEPVEPKAAKSTKREEGAGKRLPLILALAVCCAVVVGVWRWRSGNADAPAAAASVAVLPFDNLGGDAEANRLADGMTEDVITALGHFKEIPVIARSSVGQYKGKAVDARQVSKDLNVNFVLAGSVQHQGDQLRVTAHLIESSGTQVWSERWDRPMGDLFAVQAELANKIAGSLAGATDQRLGVIPSRLIAEAKRRPPANLTAYDCALLARELRQFYTKDNVRKGLELAEKAIALDPTLASPYVSRAWFIHGGNNYPDLYPDLTFDEIVRRFEADIQKALALDPANADAQAALIYLRADQGRWNDVYAEVERALSSNPTNANVVTMAATQYAFGGRPEEAVALADRALRLDPMMSPGRRGLLATTYFLGRRFEKSIELIDQIPDEVMFPLWPMYRAAGYAFLGRTSEAEQAKSGVGGKVGEQVMEVWYNKGEIFARAQERDLVSEAYRRVGFRVCATAEELKKFPNPKRLPECVKS